MSRSTEYGALIGSLTILAVSLCICADAQSKDSSDEIRLRATVRAIVPLASFSGPVTVHIESIVPAVTNFAMGSVVTLAIHSPSRLFGGEAKAGESYNFSVRRKMEDGKTRFYDLRVLGLSPVPGLRFVR
jgi:hypothetical protein